MSPSGCSVCLGHEVPPVGGSVRGSRHRRKPRKKRLKKKASSLVRVVSLSAPHRLRSSQTPSLRSRVLRSSSSGWKAKQRVSSSKHKHKRKKAVPFDLSALIQRCDPVMDVTMWSTWNTLLFEDSETDNTASSSSSGSTTEDSLPPFSSSRSPSPSPAQEVLPVEKLRLFRLFCAKETPSFLEKGVKGDKELKSRLREAWEQLDTQERNAYLLKFAPAPAPEPLGVPEEEEKCPAPGCSLALSHSQDRQFIMKHWFKEHSASQLHVLYTSSLWKRRVPLNPPNSNLLHIKEEETQEKKKPAVIQAEPRGDYSPGDLVWARVGSSNFWPAVVSVDPDSRNNEDERANEVEDEFAGPTSNGTFRRTETRRGFKFVEFHVDFFGCLQRAWVAARQTILFTGLEDYLNIYKNVYKGKLQRLNSEKWERAVRDAQSTSHMTGLERMKRLKHLQENDYRRAVAERKRKRQLSSPMPSPTESQAPKRMKLDSASSSIAAIPNALLEEQRCKLKTGMKLFHLANEAKMRKEWPKMKPTEVTQALNDLWKSLTVPERRSYREELHRITGGTTTTKAEEPPPPRKKGRPPKILNSLSLSISSSSSSNSNNSNDTTSTPSSSSSSNNSSTKAEMIGLFKNERFCIVCEEVSLKQKDLITCSGVCGYSFHKTCLPPEVDPDPSAATWTCKECEDKLWPCFICGKAEEEEKEVQPLLKCSHKTCSKYFHSSCITASSLWPQAAFNAKQVLTCPAHLCHTCASDSISNPVMKFNSRLLKCIRCPTSYHSGDNCVTAGSIQITSTAIICPKHNQEPKRGTIKHINVSWCFICSTGGSLICCDLCPASFHAECLDLPSLPEGKYYCQTCRSGRMPLYREVVWVKLGIYRWWPAAVVHPSELPENVNRLTHEMGDFPVKFFGSNEYAWTTQGRTFLYEKGDSDKMPGGSANKKTLTQLFRRGLMEAADFFKEACLAKAKQGTKKPPTYQKIKTNRPYGDVPVYSDVSSEVQLCNCDHNSENPCHEDSDCINRLLMVECMMSTCPAKERCQNMQFQRRTYPSLRVSQTDSRGWGLFVDQAMKKGRFIIEYVGELITMDEFRNRLRKCSPENEDGEEENYYYMTMDSNRMIDAGPKGNIARFMNHSCDPNCETQKWTVNGDTRVGIFTLKDIPAGSELTFNYQFEAVGEVKKTCLCGAPNCSGYIGKKPAKTTQADPRVAKKPKTKKIKFIKAWEDTCFRCYKGGEVLMCDHKTCPKVYHLECLSRDSLPHGRWFCPWHHCVECGKSAVKYCVHCPNAYCRQHESNLEEHPSLKSLCNEHDPEDIDSLLSYYNSSENREMLTSPAAPMIPVSPSATALKRRRSKGGKRGRPPASVIEEPPKGKENFFKS